MLIIAMLLAIIIAGLFWYFFKSNRATYKTNLKEVLYDKAVHDETATIGLGNYNSVIRYTDLGEHKGVWFDTATIQKYLSEHLRKIITRHTDHQRANGIPDISAEGYEWKLGFYWLVKNDTRPSKNNIPALSYYVVPILVHRETKKVLDYFDTGNARYYAHPTGSPTQKDGEDEYNVFDEGQLWP